MSDPSKRPDPGWLSAVGDRLAAARMAIPDHVQPSGNSLSANRASIRSLVAPPTGQPLPGQGYQTALGRHNQIPGSYVSPYDSGGRVPGSGRLPVTSTTAQEFERMYGSSARQNTLNSHERQLTSRALNPVGRGSITFGMMSPVTLRHSSVVQPMAVEDKSKNTKPENATDRMVFLGPLRLLRQECEAQAHTRPGAKELLAWLDTNMNDSLHKACQVDNIFHQVVYIVKIPMSDEQWANYQTVLPLFPAAKGFHDLLSKGESQVDQFTASHIGANGNKTYPQLMVEGESLQVMLVDLVQEHNLGIAWDWGRPFFRPGLVPQAFGGSLGG